MKRLLALAFCLVALAGCEVHTNTCHYDSDGSYHCGHHHTTPVVYTSHNNGGGSNNIIIIEEEVDYCQWDNPYYHDPEWCDYYYDTVCCGWSSVASEETYCYYDYCGWELVEVHTYY